MRLLGWVVGAALLDELGRREEQERELEERDRQIRELEGRISRLEATRGRDAPLIATASRQPAAGGYPAPLESFGPFGSVRPWEREGRW